MRAVQLSGGKSLELAGGAYTPLAWHRLFDGDLYDAVAAIETGLAAKPARLETYRILQLAYTLTVTADKAAGRETERFDDWAASLGDLDIGMLGIECLTESRSGLFRRAKQQEEEQEGKAKPKKG